MLATNINLADKYDYLNKRFQTAYAFLRRDDLASLPDGAIALDGDNVVAKVMCITTAEAEGRVFETHDHFFDIQFVVSGEERCDWAKRDQLTEATPYDEKKDVTFYNTPACYSTVKLMAGDYITVSPEDGHRPGCACSAPCMVKKIVVKVRA